MRFSDWRFVVDSPLAFADVSCVSALRWMGKTKGILFSD
jgi:hypothetical protein